MRSKDFGVINGVSKNFSKEETLEMFKRVCRSRAFELRAKEAFDADLIKMPIYLSLGQEFVSAALAVAYHGSSIFAQHRCHDIYLSYGGDARALRDELLHRPTGCARGMGGSASIHDPAIPMFGHDGLMGTQVPIAVGYAAASGRNTLAVMGDASAEEDYVIASLGYAAHKKAPVLLVCADNGLSILTKVGVRRNWKMTDLAISFGMSAVEITDDPWTIMHYAKQFRSQLPAFMNIHTARHLWHSGTGRDGDPEWDRYHLVKQEMAALGLENEARDIEQKTEAEIDNLWKDELPAR